MLKKKKTVRYLELIVTSNERSCGGLHGEKNIASDRLSRERNTRNISGKVLKLEAAAR